VDKAFHRKQLGHGIFFDRGFLLLRFYYFDDDLVVTIPEKSIILLILVDFQQQIFEISNLVIFSSQNLGDYKSLKHLELFTVLELL
jgi:hypothetical protein